MAGVVFFFLIYSMHVCLPPTGGGGACVTQCQQFVANRSDMTDAVGEFLLEECPLCVTVSLLPNELNLIF
jgi:hypothetical protein